MPKSRSGTSTPASRRAWATVEPTPPTRGVVLDGDDHAVPLGERGHGLVDGLDPARVDHGGGDALLVQQVRHLQAHRRQGADGDQEDVGRVGAGGRAARPCRRLGRRPVRRGRRRPWRSGPRSARRPPRRPRAAGRDLVGVARGGQPQAGDDLEDRHVPHAVVGGAVGARDTGAVQHERHAALVQGHVHQHLVEGAVEEGGVHGEDRVHSPVREAGRGDRAVLLGDADVVDAVREGLGELVEADRLEHGRGDGDDVLALLAELEHLLAEDARPVGAGGGDGQAGVGVDLADGVEAVGLVLEGGLVAAALLGEAVHDDRAAEARLARVRADSRASRSWPSMGPTYFRPRSSNTPCGAMKSFRPFLAPCRVS